MKIRDVGDAVEYDLRIEIASDTPEKIEAFVKAVADVILETAAEHDCAVSIHEHSQSDGEVDAEQR
jgi:predicted urease superfamily metal-dependent hydrolase